MLGTLAAAAPPQALVRPHLSELELFGYAALIYLTGHLFISFIWPSLRACVAVIWTDLVAGIHRVKADVKALRE